MPVDLDENSLVEFALFATNSMQDDICKCLRRFNIIEGATSHSIVIAIIFFDYFSRKKIERTYHRPLKNRGELIDDFGSLFSTVEKLHKQLSPSSRNFFLIHEVQSQTNISLDIKDFSVDDYLFQTNQLLKLLRELQEDVAEDSEIWSARGEKFYLNEPDLLLDGNEVKITNELLLAIQLCAFLIHIHQKPAVTTKSLFAQLYQLGIASIGDKPPANPKSELGLAKRICEFIQLNSEWSAFAENSPLSWTTSLIRNS